MKKLKLPPKQQLFVDFYCGNATEAARKAGYSFPNRQGHRLLTDIDVQAAIVERENREHQDHILTRQERQELLTRIILGLEMDTAIVQGKAKKVPVSMSNRLKALELLAKSHGDFLDRIGVEVSLQQELESMTIEEMEERIKKLEDEGVLDLIRNSAGIYSSKDGAGN